MPEDKSTAWTRERTYTVIARDKRGAILHRLQGVPPPTSFGVVQDLRRKHPSLIITRHLDAQIECDSCNGTGLRSANRDFHCDVCDGTERLISENFGINI